MSNATLYVVRLARKLNITLAEARARLAAQTAAECRGRYARDRRELAARAR